MGPNNKHTRETKAVVPVSSHPAITLRTFLRVFLRLADRFQLVITVESSAEPVYRGRGHNNRHAEIRSRQIRDARLGSRRTWAGVAL